MTLNSYMPVKLVTGRGCVRGSAKELAGLGKLCLIVNVLCQAVSLFFLGAH